MKKVNLFLTVAALLAAAALTACAGGGKSAGKTEAAGKEITKETITITGLNCMQEDIEREVPFNP